MLKTLFSPQGLFWLLLIVLAIVALCTSGCSTTGAEARAPIQQILNAALPDDFTGDVEFVHKNPSVDVTIQAGGLRKTDGRWTWTWLRYRRNGRVSHGAITFGTPPKGL
jgi:photosystem II stability/assembly factor-like uncharacterized protein